MASWIRPTMKPAASAPRRLKFLSAAGNCLKDQCFQTVGCNRIYFSGNELFNIQFPDHLFSILFHQDRKQCLSSSIKAAFREPIVFSPINIDSIGNVFPSRVRRNSSICTSTVGSILLSISGLDKRSSISADKNCSLATLPSF